MNCYIIATHVSTHEAHMKTKQKQTTKCCYPTSYQGPAVPTKLRDRNVAMMGAEAGSAAFAPSDAQPIRSRHRMGGMG